MYGKHIGLYNIIDDMIMFLDSHIQKIIIHEKMWGGILFSFYVIFSLRIELVKELFVIKAEDKANKL